MISLNNKLLKKLIIILILLGSMAFLFFNENGILKYLKTKSELKHLDQELRKAVEQVKVLEREIDSLKTSKEKIEKVAREKFHMMKKNEKIFKIEEK
ncbi:MAG: septum formation initiator family protein [Ignavibacteriales bacterium]|nr:MAG: septum formation initiator family protein [Ignavibacteriales bacterium]